MNTINLPADKYELLSDICSKIVIIREDLKTKPSGAKDLAGDPENCAKLYVLIKFIYDNITTNKVFLKKKLGSVMDYYEGWRVLEKIKTSSFSKEVHKLQQNNFVTTGSTENPGITSTENPGQISSLPLVTTKNSSNITEEEINNICNKYIIFADIGNVKNSLLIFKDKIKSGHNFSEIELEGLLLKIGHLFPKYILENIFHGYWNKQEFLKKFRILNIEPFWTKQSLGNHKKKSNRDLIQFASNFNIGSINKNEKSIENAIEELKTKSSFNHEDYCKYVYLLYGELPVLSLMSLLKLNYTLFYELKNALNLPNLYASKFRGVRRERPLSVAPYRKKRSSITSDVSTSINIDLKPFSILPNGDIQIIIKYGTPEHIKYLTSLNEISKSIT